jgi:hypothetical protein
MGQDTIPGFEDVQKEDKAEEQEEQLYAFEALDQFVVEVLLPLYPQIWETGVRWCAQWPLHEPAVTRLYAIWFSWEAARHDRAALSNWLRTDADYHMGVLFEQHGTFDGCSIGTLEEPEFKHAPRARRLPSAPVVPGLFPKYPTA